MNIISLISLLLLVFAEIGAAQAEQISEKFNLDTEVGLYSDYRTRGISQTRGKPAVQGSLILSHSSGAYVGVFTSNVELGGVETRQEIDLYGGYFWQLNDDVSLNVAYFDYIYRKSGELRSNEYFAELKAYGVILGAWYANNLTRNQSSLYDYVGYKFSLPYQSSLEMRYGIMDYKDPWLVSGSGATREGYREWEVKLAKDYAGLKFTVSYVDTDLSKAECASYNVFDNVCSATIVLGMAKAF